jgi:lipopolysaccharide transport system ATP-binding protein
MPEPEIAVSVRNLSKSFLIAHGGQATTAAEAISGMFRRERSKPRSELFWALKDVDFDIRRGEVVGIIGRNGAGKSTLLKILSRVVEPTTGQIDLYGRVGSLLEVGTGFHPELTGRENIFLNGAVLGLSKREITARFDEIVDFAEVGPFLDTPVKRYSSGMYVRLAFSVAAHMDPEILIVDEALAVGDMQFQKKCFGKMDEASRQAGRTILFVSHQIAPIQALCSRLLLLTQGRVTYQGDVDEGISIYRDSLSSGGSTETIDWPDREASNPEGVIRFTGLTLVHDDSAACHDFTIGEKIGLIITVHCSEPVTDINIGYTILDLYGTVLFTSHHSDSLVLNDLPAGETVLESWIDPNYLQPGKYAVQLGAFIGSVGQDFVVGAAQIEVAAVLGHTSAKHDRRPGIMRIDFPWRLGETRGNDGH